MTLFAWSLGAPEMIALLFLALILFGARKLPELGRSLGRGIVEFKKGVRGIEDDMDDNITRRGSSQPQSRPIPEDDRTEVTAPKFEPPQFEPTSEEAKSS